MPSSTSSSDPAPAPAPSARRVPLLGLKVTIGLLAFFALLEIGTRYRLFKMSKDFRRFASYPARALSLVDAQGGRRVAFIGNSATDRGLDARLLEAAMAARGRPVHADLFVADQSRIDTWRFIFERFFAAPGLKPDLVVVTFYENDLEDGNPVEIGRLAQFFTGVRDWPEVMTVNLHTLDDRASFVVSSAWATYAASERVRERLLDALIPGFRPLSEHVNQVVYQHESRRAHAQQGQGSGQGSAHSPTFVALGRLLDRAQELGIELCFVAYPTVPVPERGDGPPYDLSPGLVDLLRARHAGFIDLRRVPALGPALYADDVHLTETGRAPYSAALGTALADVIPQPLAADRH